MTTEPRTLSTLLASMEEGELRELRAGITTQMERLEVELSIVDSALALKGKRRIRIYRDSSDTTRPQQMKRGELVGYIEQMGRPVHPEEVRDFVLTYVGIDMRTEAVRTSMLRLVADGKLARSEDGKTYFVPSQEPQFSLAPAEGLDQGNRLGDG